jgi:hypothetical protein
MKSILKTIFLLLATMTIAMALSVSRFRCANPAEAIECGRDIKKLTHVVHLTFLSIKEADVAVISDNKICDKVAKEFTGTPGCTDCKFVACRNFAG